MTDIKLGELVEELDQRDAVHVAIIAMEAGGYLPVGVGVRLDEKHPGMVFESKWRGNSVGIVDPFLTSGVKPGERCWVLLFPGTVTGMRHVWQHPSFVNRLTGTEGDRDWLMSFARKWNFDYDEMIEEAMRGEGRIVAYDRDLHGSLELGQEHEKFWTHLEALTGQVFSEDHRNGIIWSCSC